MLKPGFCTGASRACSARASLHESVIWDSLPWSWGKRTRGWGGEGVFCLSEILVQNRGRFLQPSVGFSEGRVLHPGAAGAGLSVAAAVRCWCWSLPVSPNWFAFILTISYLLCCPPVWSWWWDPLCFAELLVDSGRVAWAAIWDFSQLEYQTTLPFPRQVTSACGILWLGVSV